MSPLTGHPLSKKLIAPPVLITLFVVVGFVGLLFSTIITNPYTVLYPLALLLGPVLFLATRRQRIHSPSFSDKGLVLKAGLVFYMTTILFLLISFYAAGFYRSPTVFHLTFVLYIITAVLIWLRSTPSFSLPLLITTGFANRATAYYASALYVGNDYYTHYPWIEQIVEQGSLVPLLHDKYYYAPFYHLTTAISNIVLDVSVTDAGALTTVLLITILPPIVIFAVVRYFWSDQVAAIGAFLYVASDYAIHHGIYAVTTSFAVVVCSLLILTIFRYDHHYRIVFGVLNLVFLALLSVTHQVGLFIAVVLVCSYFIGRMVYTGDLGVRTLSFPLISVAILFADFMTTRRLGPPGETTFLESYLGLVISRFPTAGTDARQEASLPPDASVTGIGAAGLDFIQVAGSAALLCLAIAGALYWLQSEETPHRHLTAFGFGAAVAAMLAVVLGFPIIGIGDLLPTRWYPFIYILLAILAAPIHVALIQMGAGLFGQHHLVAGVVLLVLVSAPFVVLMAGNHAGASDNPYLDDSAGAERFGVTETEKQLFEHTAQYEDDRIVLTDRRAATVLDRYYETKGGVDAVEIEYGDPDTIRQPSLLAYRAYFDTPQAQYRIEYEGVIHEVSGPFPMADLNARGYYINYDNGDDKLIYFPNFER